jgi:hypothetical protein
MTGLDPDYRIFLDVGTMLAVVRVAQPGSGRIATILVE